MSSLAKANIDALADEEFPDVADCDNGCSTSNNGPFCCTIKSSKGSYDLYYDEQKN